MYSVLIKGDERMKSAVAASQAMGIFQTAQSLKNAFTILSPKIQPQLSRFKLVC